MKVLAGTLNVAVAVFAALRSSAFNRRKTHGGAVPEEHSPSGIFLVSSVTVVVMVKGAISWPFAEFSASLKRIVTASAGESDHDIAAAATVATILGWISMTCLPSFRHG